MVVAYSFREAIPTGVAAAVLLWWTLVWSLRKIKHLERSPMRIPVFLGRAAAYYSVAFLAISAYGAWAAANAGPVLNRPQYGVPDAAGPNVYLILLDGYPRTDTLRDTFGFDNRPFEAELAELGFAVSSDSVSNYNKTWLTLGSMLNGQYIDTMLASEPPAAMQDQLRWLYSIVNESAMLDTFRGAGYTIRAIPGPFTSTALTSADQYIDRGYVNEFEAQLLWNAPWIGLVRDPLIAFLADNQERMVRDGLDTVVDLARASDARQLVLAHIQSPHTPFVLQSDSTERDVIPECFPRRCTFWHSTIEGMAMPFDDFADGLRAQIAALNTLVLQSLGKMVEADPDAVIIVMSDHGSRYSLADMPEHFRTFFAARTPGREGMFQPDESPVNILRVISQQYLGSETPRLEYRAWLGDWSSYLALEPYVPPSRARGSSRPQSLVLEQHRD
jgi:hypothetical protein